jgi:hypothetical protein
MKAKRTNVHSQTSATREQLNRLMEAMALIIARRQMKRHWAGNHRASLISAI